MKRVAVSIAALLLAASSVGSQPANGNYCGSTWMDAVSRCAMSCPTGAPSECIGGETCFAGTPCLEPVPETPPPVPSPQVTGGNGGTCGDGQVGNAICPVDGECCSFYGYCGTSAVHCDNQAVASAPVESATSPSTGGAAPSIFGTCGDGNVGNGICVNNNECCSMYGFCGTSEEHCSDKVSDFGPDFSASYSTSTQASVPAAPPIESFSGWSQTETASQVPAEPPVESYPGTSPTTSEYSVSQEATPQVPAAPPIESYPGISPTTSQYSVSQEVTPQVPAASPSEGFPVTNTHQQTTPMTSQIETTQVEEGTCGSGSIGNAICANPQECCSAYGFCGTSLEHCTNKAGSSGSDVSMPAEQQIAEQKYNTQSTVPADQQQQQQQYTSESAEQQYTPQVPPLSTSQVTSPAATPTQNQVGSSEQAFQQTELYQPVAPHGTDKKIIGYYAGWQWYDRDKIADPKNIDFRKVQRVNYAFFQPDAQGNIFGTDRWGDPQLLFGPYTEKLMGGIQRCSYDGPDEVNCAYHEHGKGIINLAHQAGAEVYPSIGGWTLSDHFPGLSSNPTSRDNFAKKCAEIVDYYGFDGIDVDWEYPGYSEHSGTPADKVNFTKMLQAIRAALDLLTKTTGKVYGLTAALPCNPQHIGNIELPNLLNTLTEWNLMSYDFHGAWDQVTGVDSPLYPQGFGNDEFSIDRCVKKYMDLGVPSEKLNVGLPFYGRSFKYATGLNQPHGGNDVANWPDDDGTPQYFNIYAKLPQMIQARDNKSKTQYAYTSRIEQPGSELPEGLVSFDDERAICDKVHYAQQHKMGGFIIWELSGDILPDLRTPLLDITNKKLANPAFECCLLHSQAECDLEKEESINSYNTTDFNGFDGYNWVEQNYMDETKNGGSASRALWLCFLLPCLAPLLINAFL
ncbi:hypothetical protein ACHAWO_011501 [Cyclotella atomus]|uniref:Chitinase n=1 Tax=Cyclotella atomus TaxID=382360 RepID=A0ABD3N2V3_9STRA